MAKDSKISNCSFEASIVNYFTDSSQMSKSFTTVKIALNRNLDADVRCLRLNFEGKLPRKLVTIFASFKVSGG